MRLGRAKLLPIALWLLAVLAIGRFAFFFAEAATRQSNGFAAYYTSGRLLREGEDVSRFYDDDWFQARISAQDLDSADIYRPNPPTAALLLWPVSRLGYESARVVWLLFNLLCLAVVTGWLLWQLGLKGLWLPGSIAVILSFQPVRENVYQGQAYLFLLALFTLAWYGYRHRRERLLGIALAALLILKSAGVFLCLLLLVQRRWRALAWAGGSGVAVVIGLLPWIGIGAWKNWLDAATRLGSRPELSATAYQSQSGLTRHVLTFDAQWNPAPWLHSPLLASWLEWFVILVVTGAALYGGVVSQRPDLVFAAIVTVSVVLSPLSLDYHYALLLLPIAILAAWSREQVSVWPLLLLSLSVALIGLDLPYRSPHLVEGAWALLAYPKLYGAWLLTGLALWGALRQPVHMAGTISYGRSGA